jgi:asparagine synthase (glutamine-hydrolysing)
MPALIERLPAPLRRYLSRSFLGQPAGIRSLFYENFAVFPQALQRRLFAATERARDPYAEDLKFYQQAPGGLLERMCYADLQTYLVELLMKQDQMSMAASIESRVPFLDHEFVEFAAAIPGRYKLRGLQTKAVLRDAVRDLVPREILTRGKMGFPVPLRGWFRGAYSSLLDHWVLAPRALDRGLFDPGYVRLLVAEHRQGVRDHSDRLWMLVNLELWQRIFMEGERPEQVAGSANVAEQLRAVA